MDLHGGQGGTCAPSLRECAGLRSASRCSPLNAPLARSALTGSSPERAPEMKNAPLEGRGFTWWSGRDLNPRHGDFQKQKWGLNWYNVIIFPLVNALYGIFWLHPVLFHSGWFLGDFWVVFTACFTGERIQAHDEEGHPSRVLFSFSRASAPGFPWLSAFEHRASARRRQCRAASSLCE